MSGVVNKPEDSCPGALVRGASVRGTNVRSPDFSTSLPLNLQSPFLPTFCLLRSLLRDILIESI